MSKQVSLESVAATTNPDSLVLDGGSGAFVRVPSILEAHAHSPAPDGHSPWSQASYLRLVPELNPAKVFQTASGLEAVNTTGTNVRFVSEHVFASGTHDIELLNLVTFKNVRPKLLRTDAKGKTSEVSLSLEAFSLTESVVVRIDIKQKTFSAFAPGLDKTVSTRIKGSKYRFAIELKSKGDYVSLNPMYLHRGHNNVWRLHQSLSEEKTLGFSKNWVFLGNVEDAAGAGLAETVKTLTGAEASIEESPDVIYDKPAKIAAIRVSSDRLKKAKREAKPLGALSTNLLKKVLGYVLHGVTWDGQLEHVGLIDFVTKNKDRLLESPVAANVAGLADKLKQFAPPLLQRSYAATSDAAKVEYLPDPDALLLCNGTNKIKMVTERSRKGEFVVHPQLFDTTKVFISLSKEQHAVLAQAIDWKDVGQRLCLAAPEAQNLERLLEALTTPACVQTDGDSVHITLEPVLAQTFVERLFEYLNLVINNAYPGSQADDIPAEPSEADPQSDKPKPDDNEPETGLVDLFREDRTAARQSEIDVRPLKAHLDTFFRSRYETFPTEFDNILSIVFLVEEALFLQNEAYRQTAWVVSRSHTALGRLYSFVASSLPVDQAKRLADFGLYINSSFLGQFRHFKQQLAISNDFNDQNTTELYLSAYATMRASAGPGTNSADNVPLSFTLTHQPAWQTSQRIDNIFACQGGKFLAVLTQDRWLHVLATQFGLAEVYKTDLAVPVNWTAPKQFENIIRNEAADVKDVEVEDPEPTAEQPTPQATPSSPPKAGQAAKPPHPKMEDIDKVIRKDFLNQMYQMGFPIELSKMALFDVKSSSIDDAIQQLLKLQEEKVELHQPTKTKALHCKIKPEWNCKVCTLTNIVDYSSDTPDICEACGNVADQDAYFEEEEEVVIDEAPVQPEQVFKSEVVVEPSDYILSVDFVQLRRDNLLHKDFLVVTLRRLSKVHLLVCRLAVTEHVIRHLALQNPVKRDYAAWPGYNQLKKGLVERDLGLIYSQNYEEKVLGLLGGIWGQQMLVETNRILFPVQINDEVETVLCNPYSSLNPRGSEELLVYLSGPKITQIVAVANKSRTYCQNDFDVQLVESVEAPDLRLLAAVDSERLVGITKSKLGGYTQRVAATGLAIDVPAYLKVLAANVSQVTLLHADSKVVTYQTGQDDYVQAHKQLQAALGSLRASQSTDQESDFVSPQALLNLFKTQTIISFKPSKLRNLLPQGRPARGIFSIRANCINPSDPSALDLRHIQSTQGFNLNVDLYVKAPKSTPAVQLFLASTSSAAPQSQKTFSNSYTKLELRCVTFQGAPSSKSMQPSQMLASDSESFATKNPFNLFVFESVYERVLRIKKVEIKMSSTMKDNSLSDEVLLFVFSDLALLGAMAELADLSLLTIENAIKNGSLWPGLEPCVRVSLKKAASGKVVEELEMARSGRYVAFLPLKSGKAVPKGAKHLDCFQYFGVEGEYEPSTSVEQLITGGDARTNLGAHSFPELSLKVTHDGKTLPLTNFAIVSAQESANATLVKLRGRLSLPNSSPQLRLELPGKTDAVTPVTLQAMLSNMSHPLVTKIREETEAGSIDKLSTIFRQYNALILDKMADEMEQSESAYLSLIDLLLFLLETFNEKAVAPILTIDFKKLIQYSILNSSDWKIIGAARFLLERLFGLKASHKHFEGIFEDMLARLPHKGLTHQGLDTLWKLLAKFLETADEDTKAHTLTSVFKHLKQMVTKTHALYTPSTMLLRSFGVPETLNLMPAFRPESASQADGKLAGTSSSSNIVDLVDKSTLVDWNGFSISEPAYVEYYLNCTEVIKLDQLLIRFPKIKPLMSITLEVQAFNAATEVFDTLKVKHLASDFAHYLSSRELSSDPNSLNHYHLGLNFACYDKPVKLLRVVAKINHIPVFDYTDIDSTKYDIFVHGTPIQDLVSKAGLPEAVQAQMASGLVDVIVRRSNARYATCDDELTAVPALKAKCREFKSSAVYEKARSAEVKTKDSPAKKAETSLPDSPSQNELKETLESLERLREGIEDQLKNVEVADLKPSSALSVALLAQVELYKSALEAKRGKLVATSHLEDNLTFWQTDLSFFAQQIGRVATQPEHFKLIAADGLSPEDLLTRVFFDGYFFERTASSSVMEAFLSDALRLLGPDSAQDMLARLSKVYCGLEGVVFVSNLDKFIDCLQILKLTNAQPWTKLVEGVHSNVSQKPDELSPAEVKQLLLDCSLLNGATFDLAQCTPELFAQMEQVLVWLLINRMEAVSAKFEETALVLAAQVFKLLSPALLPEYELSHELFKKVLELTSQNRMLPKIDKILADFSRGVSKVSPKTAEAKRFRALINNLKLTLMAFVNEQVLEADPNSGLGQENMSDILFFALSHIKTLDDIQMALAADKEEEAPVQTSAGGTPAPIASGPAALLKLSSQASLSRDPKKAGKTERAGSILHILPEGDPALGLFVSDILKFMSNNRIQDNALISIIANFSITEHVSSQVLFNFVRFALGQQPESRQTIIQELGNKVSSIHQRLKVGKSKAAVRDFSSLTVELLIDLLRNHLGCLANDPTVTHFAILLALHVINENENKMVAAEPCRIGLRPQLIAPLFMATVGILVDRFNFGGPENFQNFLDSDLLLFELVSDCLHIVAKGVDDSGASLLTYLVQNFKSLRESSAQAEELDTALDSLVIWTMCNHAPPTTDLRSVVGPLLKKVQTDSHFITVELFKKEEAAKILLNCICNNFRRLNTVLTRKVEKRSLGYQAVYLSENAIDYMESILKTVADNEALAAHFLLNNKGLEMIFEILHRNRGEANSAETSGDSHDGLLAQMKRAAIQGKSGTLSTSLSKAVPSANKDRNIFEDEFGARITNVHVDKTLSNGSSVKEWCANKSGKTGTIYNTQVPINRKSITLRFKTTEDFELRTMRLSVVISRSESHMVVGPVPYVHLYAIQEDEKKETRRVYLGELKRINDPGYLQFQAVVYALNINKMAGRDFVASLETLRHARELKEFELVIGRPLFTVVDRTSQMVSRTLTSVNLSINFLSVEGVSPAKVDMTNIFRGRVQTSFIRFLEIIFNADSFSRPVDEYFDTINRERRPGVYDLIESQLGPIMANFEEKMAKFLMTLSEKNKRLADAIFQFLLKNIEKKPTFFFLVERILKKTLSYRYLFDFFEFGKRKLATDIASLPRFLMVLTNYLAFLADKLEREGKPVVLALPINERYFGSVLMDHKQTPFNFQIERFIGMVIQLLLDGRLYTEVPPSIAKLDGYHIDDQEFPQDNKAFGHRLVDLVADKVAGGESIYLHILGSVALRSAFAKDAIVSRALIPAIAERLSQPDVDPTNETLIFLEAVSDNADLYAIILQQGIDKKLLTLLEEAVKRKSFKDNPELVSLTLQTVCAIHKHSPAQIEDLEATLFAMLKRNKDDSFFIEKVLLKFFEFENTRKVMFEIGRPSDQPAKPVATESSDTATLPAEAPTLKLKSAHLDSKLVAKLTANLPNLVDDSTEKSMKAFDWKRVVNTSGDNEDFSADFEPFMYLKRPFLIVMNLDNNGAPGVFGLFVPEGFVKYPDQNDGIAYVPNSDNAFLFWYFEGSFVHYKPSLDKCDKFLRFYGDESGRFMVFSFDGQERVIISLNADSQSTFELYGMKCVASDNNPDYEFPYDCMLNSLEIHQLELKLDEKVTAASEASNEYLLGKYLDKLGTVDVLGSFFSDQLSFLLPEQLPLKSVKTVVPALLLDEARQDKLVKDLPAPSAKLPVSKNVAPLAKTAFVNHYTPFFPIFEVFLQRGGIQFVIEAVKNNDNISFFKDNAQRDLWRQLMDDLLELKSIEGFLGAMTQSKDFLPVLFELFVGSSKSNRNWEEAEFNISNLLFDKLTSILRNTDSVATRYLFFEKNVLRKLLDKLRTLTYDNVRTYKPDAPEEAATPAPVEPAPEKDEPLLKEIKKRKGVGYEKEGSGKKFMVNEYLAKKKQRNEFVVTLLRLFKSLFSLPLDSYKPDDETVVAIRNNWFRTIAESSLLPMLESAFKCSSLHEMSKEADVYEELCQALLTFGRHSELRPLMDQLPSDYKPPQLESLASILRKQEANTALFQKFALDTAPKAGEADDKQHSIELANLIMSTIDQVKAMYPQQFDDGGDDEYEDITEADLAGIRELPVNEQYKIAFRNLRFDLVDFKKPNESNYEHHYASSISSDAKSSNPGRMVRLAQEITDLSSSLPIDSYNSITVRADVNRLDVIKSIIAGAENTPYAHGLFEYHVYLPPEYPASPPKCNLETTGSGDVRFNPNLYSCGKVCLSLLGTWRGSASENWDPKISNLLQLFLSIQSVVMSEEVYFNEPGYEGEAGTEEGEKKNEGYSNIVRLNNIKHAMIKQIKTPPVGFEEVARRHFYIKRHVIIKEVSKWVKFAEVRPCTYNGLVSDHNNKYASRFSANTKTYVTELKAAIADLEKTLKQLVETSDPHHIFANKRLFHGKSKAKSKQKPKAAAGELKGADVKVDTTWDDIKKAETFDTDDRKVADRWSRYIGAMGIEAVKKQSTAKVAVVGMGSLGLEIAKNIVLSGVNTLTLVDWRKIAASELLGNFYAEPTDVGVNRAACVKAKIQQLNFYVKVEDIDLEAAPSPAFVADQTVLIITDNYLPKTTALLEAAREAKVKVVIAETVGIFARIFVDFGAAFVVNDRDGEDPSECYIKSIDHSTNVITLFDKSFNQLRDGDFIVISEADTEAPAPTSTEAPAQPDLNGSIHKIKSMRKVTEIEVEDLSKFRRYQRNGKVKELKVPLTHKYRDYSQLTPDNHAEFLDENLAFHDFMKVEAIPLVSKCFLLKERFEKSSQKEIGAATWADVLAVVTEEERKDDKLVKKLAMLWATAKGALHSLYAFIGGMVSQEAIIGITGKFTPIKQLFCTDVEEVLTDDLRQTPEALTAERVSKVLASEGKYGRLALLIGPELLSQLKDSRLFMVGAGAIGCELLKNCAMVGLGCGPNGSLTLTDPDSIELSNLNRQFLFREKHIAKPKSLVAASVVQTMNPDYNGKIVARLEKVCDDTEEIYNDAFIQRQSICLNALDNVKARVYMDQRCVKNQVPLLESGTLGPKGHVQVIVPGVTENYAQVRDANEEHNIPVCTLKMFPEEPVHCMEWAKDRFEVLFSQNPKSVQRVLEEWKAKGDVSNVYAKIKKAVFKLLKCRPKDTNAAIEAARRFYQKAFSNKVNQLLHVYPLDHKTKDGKLFWTLPKRPPVPRTFDLADPIDAKFIDSYAKLLCRIWGLSDKLPEAAGLKAAVDAVPIEPFKPKDSDMAKIKKDVEKMEKKDVEEPKEEADKPEQPANGPAEDETALNNELNALLASLDVDALLKQVKPEVFEKDNDANNHIDLIYSLSALRSRNYKLPEMDWMTTKLKAGRIVPALATTTATIAALQTIEAIKLVKKSKADEFKNCFLNLAIPNMTLSEPGPAAKFKIHDGLTVTVWDRWTYDFDAKTGDRFESLVSHIEATYKLAVVDVLKDNKPIFLSALNDRKAFEKVRLSDLLELESGESCYVSVICKLDPKDDKVLSNLPLVRVTFASQPLPQPKDKPAN
jgi:ubiquitin-activating enzyme E1